VVPDVPRTEHESLLTDMRACFISDAALLASIAHQSHMLHDVLLESLGVTVSEPKRKFAQSTAQRQLGVLALELGKFCTRTGWADVEPIKGYLCELLRRLESADGEMAQTQDILRVLRRLRRVCHAVHQVLADTLVQTRPRVKALVTKIWDSMKVEVPLSLQPPPVRVKVVEVRLERERQRRMRAYPSGVARESVMLQYAVDTQLDTALMAALEDVTTARVMASNPMHGILLRIKSSAQYFEHWKETDTEIRAKLLNEPTISDARMQIFFLPSSPAAVGKKQESETIYGVKQALLLPDCRTHHALRALLADFWPARSHRRVQRYDCNAHVAFVNNMLCQGWSSEVASVHTVELREDHFIHGPVENEAIDIHCQHVSQALFQMHNTPAHIIAAVWFGATCKTVAELPAEPRETARLIVRALKEGHAILLQAYALVDPEGDVPRYIEVNKSFHLCHFVRHLQPSVHGERKVRCWPPRTTQVYDSIFISIAHAQSCLEVEGICGDPLHEHCARRWEERLGQLAHDALRGGQLLPGCQALLQRSFLEPLKELLDIVPGVGRLLRSSAARLQVTRDLCRTIQGLLYCTRTECNKDKCNQQAVKAMLQSYRVSVMDHLSSDGCCNFEPIRSCIQEAFYAIDTDLRQNSVLTQDALRVLEAIEDYMLCIELALASQVVSNDYALQAAVATEIVRLSV